MKALIQDIRYGVRTLRRKPGFTAAAIVTLALGIGANTAIFSFVHGVLLQKLPYPNQDRIQMIFATNPQQNLLDGPLFYADYRDIREQNQSLEKVAGYLRGVSFTLLTDQGAESIGGAIVTPDFFDVLGVKAQIGRGFQTGDDSSQSPSLIVISERLWRKHFNADPNVIGRIVNFTNGPHTVLGIMPASFQFPGDGVDVWRNYRVPSTLNRGGYETWAIGRLKPETTARQAQADLESIGSRLQRLSPLTNAGMSFRLKPIEEFLFGDARTPLYVLLAAVGFVLLIASANVANLMLARFTAREKEVAIRTALGAGQSRIVRQLITESMVLAAAGGLAGLAVAGWALDVFVAVAPVGIPRLDQVSIDRTVLAFTALISLASGVLFGIAPALQSRAVDLNSKLKEAGRGNTVAGSNRLRSALVVSEVALSLVLLIGAGVTVRSFYRLRQVDVGFDSTNVLAVRMGVNPAKYDTREKILAFYEEAQRRVSGLPGVTAVGLTNSLPPIQTDASDTFTIEGRTNPAGDASPLATVLLVTPGYFKALNIPVTKGRSFADTDRPGASAVVIINEALAKRTFGPEDPIGKRMKIGGAERPDTPWMQIVGVVKDVRYSGLRAPVTPAYYMPYPQVPQRGQDLVIKTSGDPARLISSVRAEVRAMDPDIPFARVTTLEERMAQAVGEPRFQTTLLGVFSAVAVLLAAVGIYAVVSYSISLRTHEIGVRMSLGASRTDVMRMVLREGMVLVLIGSAGGLAGAFALTRLMAGVLFEVSPHDPATFVAVSLIMLSVAFLACFIPAKRATRVDPMVALRCE